jgi:hypothetical protein
MILYARFDLLQFQIGWDKEVVGCETDERPTSLRRDKIVLLTHYEVKSGGCGSSET